MHYYSLASILLLAPAALAIPAPFAGLEARQTALPTCDPNNVEILKSAVPSPKRYCSRWQSVPKPSQVSITGLNSKQVTNICKCVLATSYVSNKPLTRTSATTTAAPTTTSAAGAACTAGSQTNSNGITYNTSCGSTFNGQTAGTFSLADLPSCKKKCTTTSTCAGAVWTESSKSCVLYSSISGTSVNAGAVAFQYVSGRSSTTSAASTSASGSSSGSSSGSASSTSSESSSTTSASTTSAAAVSSAVPSVFNIYVASAAGASSGGKVLAAVSDAANFAATRTVGIFPTPTPLARMAKRQDSCDASYTVNGNEYAQVCGSQLDASQTTFNIAAGSDFQPSSGDKITTLQDCIKFCNKVNTCKAVNFDTSASSPVCTVFTKFDKSKLVTPAASTQNFAYRQSLVPAVAFYFDSASGYLYANDSVASAPNVHSGNVLAVDVVTTVTATPNYKNQLLVAPIDASQYIPLKCSVDGSLRLSCSIQYQNIYYGKFLLSPSAGTETNQAGQVTQLDQKLYVDSGSAGSVSLYIAAASASTSTSVPNTSADETLLATASDFAASKSVDPSTAGTVALTSAGALNFTFAVPATGSVTATLKKNVFLYDGDDWRFSASVALPGGKLTNGLTCTVAFGFQDGSTQVFTTNPSLALDGTFPTQFDVQFEGTIESTKTLTSYFTVACQGAAFNVPLLLSNVQLKANPAQRANGNYAFVYDTQTPPAVVAVYEQYYTGTGLLMPNQLITLPTAQTAIGDNDASASETYYNVDQATAKNNCAKSANSGTQKKSFEVYYDTAASQWTCITFAADYSSDSAFNVASSSATQVSGYYLTTIVKAPLSS